MLNTAVTSDDHLGELIDKYLTCKADLERYINALSDSSNGSNIAQLHKLERFVDCAFEQLLEHDKSSFKSSLLKLKFFLDEAAMISEVSEPYQSAVRATLADLESIAEGVTQLQQVDRRVHARTRKNLPAIFIGADSQTCRCTIENLSFQGVCLTIEKPEMLCENFKLAGVFAGGLVEATEVWRQGSKIGARITACTPE